MLEKNGKQFWIRRRASFRMIPKSARNSEYSVKTMISRDKKMLIFFLFRKRRLWSILSVFAKKFFCCFIYLSLLFFRPIVLCASARHIDPQNQLLSRLAEGERAILIYGFLAIFMFLLSSARNTIFLITHY